LEIASHLLCPALVIDTELAAQPLGQSRKLADALGAQYIALENLEDGDSLSIALQRLPNVSR
jgi:Mg-chelatase subunit ChlD